MGSISKAVADYNKYTCIRYVRLHESEEELKKREIVLDRVRFIINSSLWVYYRNWARVISYNDPCECASVRVWNSWFERDVAWTLHWARQIKRNEGDCD